MKARGFIARAAVGAIGGALVIGGAGAAIADEIGDEDVEVSVTIEELPTDGALTLAVAAASTTLAEVDSGDAEIRRFDGELPVVTVTDDREEVPAEVFWYVVGQSSALDSDTASLPAGHLGWTPSLITEGDGEVTEGDQVDTVLDEGPDNVGLVGEELLALTLDSGEARTVGTWQAGADLFLKTPVDVAPGAYTGTITLTLWEDAY